MPTASAASPAVEFLNEVRKLFEDGTRDDAFDLLDAYLHDYPDDPHAELLKVELSLEANRNAAFIGDTLVRLTSALPDDERVQQIRTRVEEEVREHLDEGRRDLRDRYGRNARESFESAMNLAPTDPAVPLAAALAQLEHDSKSHDKDEDQRSPLELLQAALNNGGTRKRHRDEDIRRYLQRTLEIGPADHPACIEATEHLIRQMMHSGDLTRVFELLDDAIALDPRIERVIPQVTHRTVVSVLSYAAGFLNMENDAQSGQLLEACLDAAPNLALTHLLRAELLIRAGDNSRALDAYQHALALSNTVPDPPTLNQARALWQLADSMPLICPRCGKASTANSTMCAFCDRTFDDYTLLIERHRLGDVAESVVAHVGLAEQFAAQGEIDRALEHLNTVLDALPGGHKSVRGLRGLRGQWLNARHPIPEMEQPVDALLMVWERKGLTPEVLAQIQHLCESSSNLWTEIAPETTARLGQDLLTAGELVLARNIVDVTLDRADHAELYAALETAAEERVALLSTHVQAALDACQPEHALTLIDEALTLQPDDDRLHLQRAEARLALRDPLGAIGICRAVLDRVQDADLAGTTRLSLARALEAYGELDPAIAVLETLDVPAAAEIRERIARRQRGEPVIVTRPAIDVVMHDTLQRVPTEEYHIGYFAVTVGAVRRPWSSGNWAKHILDAGMKFVQTLSGLRHQESDPIFALRLIAHPDPRIPERGSLTTAFVIRVSAPEEERCRTLALDLWHSLRTILPLTQDFVYNFEPVGETQVLLDLLEPFELDTITEIVRREEVPEQSGNGYTIYPFTPGSVDLHTLCWTLLRQPAPSMLSIHLLPTDLMPWESATLKREMLTAPRTASEATDTYPVSDSLRQTWQDTQIWAHAQANRHLVDTLRASAYVMGITVAGSAGTSPLLPEVVATSLFGPPYTDGAITVGGYTLARALTEDDISAACRNLHQIDVERWVYSAAPEGGHRLRHLVGEGQAALAFRLPIPGEDGLPGIASLDVKPIAPPATLPQNGTALGLSVVRINGMPLRITQALDDRRCHTYVVGKTGTGKSTLLKYMALQDIEAGHGVCVIDPHGDLVEDILVNIPAYRVNDVILFDPADAERPIGLNLLSATSDAEKHRIVTEFLGLLVRMYDPKQTGIVGPRFQHNVRNAMLTAMAVEGSTLIEVVRVLTDKHYMRSILDHVTDPLVRQYWEKQIANTSDFHKSEILDYIVSKFSRFVGDQLVRNIVGQRETTIDFRDVMDRRKVLLVNLSKGKIGPESAQFLGLLLVQRLLLTALSRADVAQSQRPDFFLYVDEFQNFATDLFATVLSEGRKYGVAVTVANQYLTQLDYAIREAIFGNVGSIVSFRSGTADAAALAPELYPTFGQDDLLNLPKFTTCCKLLIDGLASRPFTMRTVLDSRAPNHDRADLIRALSRQRYGRDAVRVNEDVLARFEAGLR